MPFGKVLTKTAHQSTTDRWHRRGPRTWGPTSSRDHDHLGTRSRPSKDPSGPHTWRADPARAGSPYLAVRVSVSGGTTARSRSRTHGSLAARFLGSAHPELIATSARTGRERARTDPRDVGPELSSTRTTQFRTSEQRRPEPTPAPGRLLRRLDPDQDARTSSPQPVRVQLLSQSDG